MKGFPADDSPIILNSLVLLNYSPELNFFMSWLKQLIAESLGKKNKGILPIVSIMPRDNHSVMQLYLDVFAFFFHIQHSICACFMIKIQF